MNAPRVPPCRRHWMWLGVVLFIATGPVLAENDVPKPRVLTAQEWAGVQAAHDDPRPAVRKAAETLMLQIGGSIIRQTGNGNPSVPFTISDPASLPPWTRPTPEKEEATLPAAGSNPAGGRSAIDWEDAFKTLNPSAGVPVASLLLENDDPAVVHEALRILDRMEARRFAPQIAPLAFHRDESIAATAIQILGEFKAKDQADMLVRLAELRPSLKTWIMSALVEFDDSRAVPIALDLMKTSLTSSTVEVLKKLGGPEHGPAIARWLSSNDESVQIIALETLAALKAVNQAAAVARLIEMPHAPAVRGHAVETLAELNAGTYAGRIAELLADSDLVWYCVQALGKLGSREHAGALFQVLRRTTWDARQGSLSALQTECVQALFRMGVVTRREALRELEIVMQQSDFFGWYHSASLFIELDSVENIEQHLRRRGAPPTTPSPIWEGYAQPPDVLRQLGFDRRCHEIAWFLQSDEPAVVMGAVDALRKFNAREHAADIAALLSRGLPDPVRIRALGTLSDFRARQQIPAICRLLRSDESREVRREALAVVTALKLDLPTLEVPVAEIAALLVPEELNELRRPALKLFAGLKGAEPYADRLVALTKADLPLDERIEALEVLLRVHPVRGLERLEEWLRPAETHETRLAVLTMLKRHPVKRAAPLLAGLLAEEDEQTLLAVLDALQESGGDAQTDEVLPLLRHPNWNVQRQAAEVLCELGPRGRSRLFERAQDALLRGMAMTAMMEKQDADVARLTNPGSVSSDALIRRAVYWAGRREQGVAPALAESLLHDHAKVRAASLAALMVCGGEPKRSTVLFCLEAALRFPDEAGPLLLAAYMFAAPGERTALPWLGGRSDEHPPSIPHGAEERAELLSALWRTRVMLNQEDFPNLRRDLPQSAESIITSATEQWTGADLPLLESVAADLQQMPWVKESAAEVAGAVIEVRANTPLRRALRWSAWIVGGQLVLWLVVLLLYPWSAAAQRMLWSRGLRRGLGWWVEPLVLRTPWLRDRMWRPFREQLVPPGEVLTFDEWTFFDAVRIAPEGGAPFAALPVLRLWRGVGVLRGESGLGKTTLLQALVSAASRPAVLLRAVECSEGLTAAIQARLPQGLRGDAAFLRALLGRGSPDVYVDAVQEAPAEVQARLTKDAESLPGGNILFTTQPCAWMPPAGAMVWDVQPLRAADIAPFLLKQGTAAIEAAGGQSLAQRQAAFTARLQTFLNELSALQENDPRAVAQTRMLSNPMEAVLAAELLAAGQTPDPARLLAQRMEHLEEDFAAEQGGAFPARPLAAHLLAWRQSGRPDPDFVDLSGVASFLARHRLLRKIGETGWRFRHDKILDWFLRPARAVYP
jgi:HEAT repeat protein